MEWKLFGDIAEVAGQRTVAVSVEEGATVGDALDALLTEEPDLRDRVLDAGDLAAHVTVLRNGESVDPDDGSVTVEAGDELALLPPVSGG